MQDSQFLAVIFNRFSALLLAICLCSCVSSGTKVSQQQLSQFVVGKTTYDQVIESLGAPNGTATVADGRRVAVYSYTHAEARPESFIPLIGPFIGGADASSQTVTFVFDNAGILQSGSSSQGQTGVGENLAAGSGTASDPTLTMPTGSATAPHKLGVIVSEVSQPLAAQVGLGSPKGAFVAKVADDSAAQHAGVQQGDIILQLGYDVVDVPSRLVSAIADVPSGKATTIVVWRNRTRVVLPITL